MILDYAPIDAEWDPPRIVSSILTVNECQDTIRQSDPYFTKSTEYTADIRKDVTKNRTSESTMLERSNPVAQKIITKAAELAGVPVENCEDVQVVRYKPGMYYKPHHDACCDDTGECVQFAQEGGQRIGTLIVYLNEDFTDGETHFPKYNNLKLKPPTGNGVFFRPLGTTDRRCHPLALHAGLPTSRGMKYICTAWVREFSVPIAE
jgi:prolyl 4-hydroxylase